MFVYNNMRNPFEHRRTYFAYTAKIQNQAIMRRYSSCLKSCTLKMLQNCILKKNHLIRSLMLFTKQDRMNGVA